MRGVIVVWLSLLLGTGPAAADDFTGFYAGVNAGWAFERGDSSTLAGSVGSAREAEGLPPSVSRIEQRRLPEKPANSRTR